MSGGVPRHAAVLTALGVLPFVAGALLSFAGNGQAALDAGSYPVFLTSDGIDILMVYGLIILNYMAGCFWGFAAKSETAAPLDYLLAVLPALYALFAVGANILSSRSHESALLGLIIGFVGILAFDVYFQRKRLAPEWWMSLRIPVTVAVVICLTLGWTNA